MTDAGTLDRRQVVARLMAARAERTGGEAFIVCGLGQPCYDVFAAGDDDRVIYLWGAMGGAVPMGIGLAGAQGDTRTLVVTGDGEVLMGLGSLAVAGAEGLENLTVVVLDNERYGETGQQVTHTGRGVDLTALATATGFRQALTVTDDAGLEAALPTIMEGSGPTLVVIKISAAPQPLTLPPKDGTYLKNRFREAVLGVKPA